MQGGSIPGFVVEWDTTDHLFFICGRCEKEAVVTKVVCWRTMGDMQQLAFLLRCPHCQQEGQYKVSFAGEVPVLKEQP